MRAQHCLFFVALAAGCVPPPNSEAFVSLEVETVSNPTVDEIRIEGANQFVLIYDWKPSRRYDFGPQFMLLTVPLPAASEGDKFEVAAYLRGQRKTHKKDFMFLSDVEEVYVNLSPITRGM